MGLSEWAGLAATTFFAALLYTISGFGFALLAAPLYLLFVDPTRAIQLVIIISTALSIVVIPGLRRAVAPWLLLRLVAGSLVGLPVGLVAFRLADPVLVRGGRRRSDPRFCHADVGVEARARPKLGAARHEPQS